jgi:hypothetical protein
MNKRINQPINQSINQSINLSINQSLSAVVRVECWIASDYVAGSILG